MSGEMLHSKGIAVRSVLVVLNYNDADNTERFIEMACKCDCLDTIVVVDNHSSDDSYERLLLKQSKKVVVLESSRNGGYAYGNNLGCKYAIDNFNPDILFIANPDVEFNDQTVRSMQEALTGNTTLGVVAPIVNQGYNIWNAIGYWGIIESIFLLWFNIDKRITKAKLIKSTKLYELVNVVEGSFFAISREAYEQCDGMDERTFLYCEEIILAHRLTEKGFREAALPQERYNHFHSVSIKKRYGNKRRAYHNYHKSMLVYLNNYVGIGYIRRFIFEVCFWLGYIERATYDLVATFRH